MPYYWILIICIGALFSVLFSFQAVLIVIFTFLNWRIFIRNDSLTDALVYPLRFVCGRYGWFGY